MSRCFPFPPPGYEKKAKTDDVDLLKKEKEKEKQHKKEKREGKERKEKDRSDGKHRDKKGRKEKHRDRKTEERDKDKDKDSRGGREFSQKEKERNKDRSSISNENRFAGQFAGYNGEKLSKNSHLAQDSGNSKCVPEMGSKVKDEDRGTENPLVENFVEKEQKRETARLVSSMGARTLAEGKEKTKRSDNWRLDGPGIGEETSVSGNALVHNVSEAVPARVDRIPRRMEKHVDWWTEGKEKTKEKESDHGLRDKNKDENREKKSHAKGKDRDKEKKREEKAKAKGEQRNVEQGNLNDSNKVYLIDTVNLKTFHPSEESNKNAIAEENLQKRKHFDKNGFIHANDIKLDKLPKPNFSHTLKDNSMILQSSQASLTPFNSDGHGPATNLKVENKERKVNGIIQAQMFPVSSTTPSLASAQAEQLEKVPTKPPHPDSKFLSQVLSVPKVEECSDFEEQEWLFENNGSQLKKPKMVTSEINETPQVWAQALRIESADVYALPYVIPY